MSLDFPLPLSKYISLGCGTSARLWRGTDITSFGITLQCDLATHTNNVLRFQENNVELDSGYMSYLVFKEKFFFMIISRPGRYWRLCLDQYKMTLRYITFIFTKNYINLLFLRHRGISSCPDTCWWSYQGSLGRVEDGHQEPQACATFQPGSFLRRIL